MRSIVRGDAIESLMMRGRDLQQTHGRAGNRRWTESSERAHAHAQREQRAAAQGSDGDRAKKRSSRCSKHSRYERIKLSGILLLRRSDSLLPMYIDLRFREHPRFGASEAMSPAGFDESLGRLLTRFANRKCPLCLRGRSFP